VNPGFFVIATIRGSQRDLTPALASRFLSYEVCPTTGRAGLEQLVKCYASAPQSLLPPLLSRTESDSIRQAVALSLGETLSSDTTVVQIYELLRSEPLVRTCDAKFRVGAVSEILKAFRAWRTFRTRFAEWAALPRADQLVEVRNALKVLCKIILMDKGSSCPAEELLAGEENWPVTYQQLQTVGQGAEKTFTVVGSRKNVMNLMATCITCGLTLVQEGPAGVGKTKMVEVMNQLVSTVDAHDIAPKALEVINFSKNTTIQDIAGYGDIEVYT
jgi:MoxR-like ATPase